MTNETRELCDADVIKWLTQYAHDLAVPPYARDMMEKAAAAIQSLSERNAVLEAALKPFADFANLSGAGHLPDEHVITLGSGMAARQLTMGDCRKARAALTPQEGKQS